MLKQFIRTQTEERKVGNIGANNCKTDPSIASFVNYLKNKQQNRCEGSKKCNFTPK